jgi:sugar lactone lactonase YvrE
MNPRFICALLGSLLVGALPLRAFDFIADFNGPFAANRAPGTTTLRLQLANSGPLIDGNTYTTSFQSAVDEWNRNLGTLRFTTTVSNESPNSVGNGINEIYLPSSAAASTLGGNTLAATFNRYSGVTIIESDIVFNSNFRWDSYRGSRAAYPDRFDLRRVALHELGHLIGLDHPDQASPPQSVTAIMNSRVSNTLDSLQADDIAGGQTLYGAPGFVPSNDNFRDATPVTSNDFPLVIDASNVAATKEPGEPAHAGDSGGRSVWWRWTAPSAGPVTLTTLGSRFDTVLAVYTGSAVNALANVTSNDNSSGGNTRTSSVTFNATAGTTYFIAVDGNSGASASVRLNFSFASGAGTALPALRTNPSSLYATPGGAVTLTVNADRASSFQWLFNGNPISGATSATLTLSGITSANAGEYRVRVTNSAGTITSPAATLTVLNAPLPTLSVANGRAVAVGLPTSNDRVQWQLSTNGGASWSNVADDSVHSGSATNTLTINASTGITGRVYRALVTGLATGGTLTTAGTTLVVHENLIPLPSGVVADGAGGWFVADSADDVILRYTTNGVVSVVAGVRGQSGSADGSASAARFNDPLGLARDSAGNLYVADSGNGTVRRIASDGTVSTFAGNPANRGSADGTGSAASFSAPAGLALDSSGNLYVTDSQAHVLRRITPTGVVTTLAGTARSTGDADGTGAAARFNSPTGLTITSTGTLFVADSGNHLIRRVTLGGAVTTAAGLAGVADAFDGVGTGAVLNQPTGIAAFSDGNVYFTDLGSSLVRRLAPDGSVTTIAGLFRITGQKDGTAREVWWNQPRAIAAGSENLVVADGANAALRTITPTGTVTTLALSTTGVTPVAPVTPVTPTTPTTPTTGGGSGGGGGGGAPSVWAVLALCTALAARRVFGRPNKR